MPSVDLQTRDVPPVDPDEEPCPYDPRDGRAALTYPAQPHRLDVLAQPRRAEALAEAE